MPTVQQVWRLALPETARLLNRSGDLSRQVSWAQRMAHHAPAFAALEAGELALLSVDAIRLLGGLGYIDYAGSTVVHLVGHPVYGLELADWLPQLGVQALGAVVIAAFTAVCGLILFFVLKKVNMVRVGRDAELFGLDIALHKTYAYPEEMADQQFGR